MVHVHSGAASPLDQAPRPGPRSRPLPADLRDGLEHALGADLSAVRVHTGPAADAVARAFRADAVASGSEVFFRDGAYAPGTAAGRWLLAHEVAHVVQQAGSLDMMLGGRAPDPAVWEHRADAFADAFAEAFAAGTALPAATAATAPPQGTIVVRPGPTALVQRHSPFEHRLLGDGIPADLVEIARSGPGRRRLLERQTAWLGLFRDRPRDVTAAQLAEIAPEIRTLTLGPDRVLASHGEVTALAGYFADAEQIDQAGAVVLLPVLQLIRQEGWNRLSALTDGADPDVRFALAPDRPAGRGLVAEIVDSAELDRLTADLGIAGQDHYRGLLARNACHFAPYSWHRWAAAAGLARRLARRAFLAPDAAARAELTRQAWVHHGYADHFLQDSFAAGHLIDKTLVAQWFVEWAGETGLLDEDSAVRYLTAALQPGISAGRLYDPAYQGPSNDPQTAQELARLADRVAAGGSGLGRETDRLDGYLRYLSFLGDAAAQLAAATVHDQYNATSLFAASAADPEPYRVWGDDTLLTGPDGAQGVQRVAETAELARRALREILGDGGSAITVDQLRGRFPNRAGVSQDAVTDLHSWAVGQRPWIEEEVFKPFSGRLEELIARLGAPHLGLVSRDEGLADRPSDAGPSGRNILTLPDGGTAGDPVLPVTARNVAWESVPALGQAAVFNGVNASIETAGPVLDTAPGRGFTVSAWVRLDSVPAASMALAVSQAGTVVSAFSLGYAAGQRSWVFERAAADQRRPGRDRLTAGVATVPGAWTHVAGVYDPAAVSGTGANVAQMRVYVNGERKGALSVSPARAFAATGPLQIGVARYDGAPDGWLHGAVRDVRVFDRALDDVELAPEPAAFWRLDDGAGILAVDRRRVHDAVASAIRWRTEPGVGGCAGFHAPDSGVTTTAPVVDTGIGASFTVAAWVRLDAAPREIVTLAGQSARSLPAFALQYVPELGWVFARATADQAGARLVAVSSDTTGPPGVWTHVAGVYDAVAGQLRVFVDGTLRRSGTFDRRLAFDADGPFTIGYGRHGGTATGPLPGTVRDVRVYHQPLSAGQIAGLYERPVSGS